MVAELILPVLLLAGPAVLAPAEIFKRASPSVVLIVSIESESAVSQGSGVAVDDRTVVTNWHVVESGRVLGVKLPNGSISPALLVGEDRKRDLALLRLITGDLPPARLRMSAPEVGAELFTIGAPQGLERSMSRGILSAIRELGEGETLLQTDAAISQGSSGGGLFDDRAQLVGVTTLSVKSGQALNFAVPAVAVRRLVDRGVSELAAQKLCQTTGDLATSFWKRLSQREQKQLGALLARVPCGTKGTAHVSAAASPTETNGAPSQGAEAGAQRLEQCSGSKLECWRSHAERFRAIRKDEEYATASGFLMSQELSACHPCSIATGLGAANKMISWLSAEPDIETMASAGRARGASGTDFSAALDELLRQAREEEEAEACAVCQLDAFRRWKNSATARRSGDAPSDR